ncbi:MAG: heme exporter protein CcmB [Candidatus Thiodiazotropha endolucinida]|uniref:Heme exporter protein B n=1 Tax=Candidatus Thiodiazotropha taylori TaxID=2792791 RepID=A0A9E4NY24_9GAMM|nr:heme exporter protein CcmB [Candidatus Thiodiazotropha sp. (ex Lucina pensylvanica)]MBT3017566.1 heme exporter protein CcmB [Candidatus Thiodiazotropha taylori]MBT3040063.1 heme exporter protein CcmB [Candidatus Thiodiazotropha sp. (ex Codakia orbicularis)]MBV2103609.1 heme exporter protein CcmB [Candidatus Thiodiazotropha sp. (ex Lucina aurantia)]MBW9267196.1 heme exporter protein CcmB [Candidatus Thiodiazotropha sp. (ex. Lucinisca nassula)]MCG7863900.1 heme exporter protein CcmB [Candidat
MSTLSLSSAFSLLLKRDLVLAYRRRAELANPMLFFILVTAMFPLGIGNDPKLIEAVGPGVIWVAALLAALLSLDSMFRSDYDDGSLEQFMLSAHPVSILVLAKILAHWLVTGLPLFIIAPLLAVLLHIPGSAVPTLMLTLLLGTPVLSLIGSVGVALTVGLRRGGMILSLLVLPLYVPVLIFATDAVKTAIVGIPTTAQLSILSAMLVGSLVLAPMATAASLRISLS